MVIPDSSISTMHAFVRIDEDGKFYLQDMMSKNGTFVYNQRVPALGTGEPLPFATGDRIRLGTLKLTFLAAAEFITMVNQLSG
jgi:pSer/pThr/pTyr-binding forkhead associated (FHA) protein